LGVFINNKTRKRKEQPMVYNIGLGTADRRCSKGKGQAGGGVKKEGGGLKRNWREAQSKKNSQRKGKGRSNKAKAGMS